MQDLGKYLLFIGGLLVVLGLVLWGLGGKLSWFGNLPGDIRIEKENFSFYFPITSMILVSLLLSGTLWVVNKFLR